MSRPTRLGKGQSNQGEQDPQVIADRFPQRPLEGLPGLPFPDRTVEPGLHPAKHPFPYTPEPVKKGLKQPLPPLSQL